MVVGEDEDLILDCYFLARWYHVSPDVFLDMPISMVRLHLYRTSQLHKKMHPPSDLDDG
jgi:hypothetical protein